MLSQEALQRAQQYNLRARQILWRGIVDEACPIWKLEGQEAIEWILNFQETHGLREDGRLGPSSLIVMMAQKLGGLGKLIIGGKEIENTRAARMFVPKDAPEISPDCCCILSVPELAYACRDRICRKNRLRSHFSIDSSEGTENESLIIQWADPLRCVDFCPCEETGDYPKNRACIGIELENVLLLHQLDADERHWMKRRVVTKAEIGEKMVSQPALYEAQIKALQHLLEILSHETGIPVQFPIQEDRYFTGILPENRLSEFRGILGKFHYSVMNHEPGAGFASTLEALFGPIKTKENQQVTKDSTELLNKAPINSVSESMALAREELSQSSSPNRSFLPEHEDLPRFNLSKAIASAYGKAGRAERMIEKIKNKK